METVFVDSTFIIADSREQDQYHSRALELNKSISGRRVISDVILHEVLTFVKSRDGPDKAHGLGEKLLDVENTIIIIPNLAELVASLLILKKYEDLSFCDALITVQMRRNGIKNLLSFDSGFDIVPWIQRIF